MGIECKDQCRHHLLDDHHNFESVGFYCRTCSNYLNIDFLFNKRCGCCKSKVRLRPRFAESNKRKVQARHINMKACTRCGSTKTKIRKSTGKPRWTKTGLCFACYQTA